MRIIFLRVIFVCIMLAAVCTACFACGEQLAVPAPSDNNTEDTEIKLITEGDWWLEEFEVVPQTDEEYATKVGGFIKGVCHPTENYEQIKEANLGWIRIDINSLPFDENGEPAADYLKFKKRAQDYVDNGIKIMAVTPYPTLYIEEGLDPRNKDNHPEIMQIARYYAEDLQGLVSALQITNEMGIDHFTLPLTLEEAAEFIGIQAKAMYRYRKNIVVGYNLSGLSGFLELNSLMQPYLPYCDYVGTDIYLGCFETTFTTLGWMKTMVALARQQTNKPIMLNEFGYIGAGQRKSAQERLDILKRYGAQGETFEEAEQYARGHMKDIIYSEEFPEKFRQHLELVCEITPELTEQQRADAYASMGNKLFDSDLISHFYCELKEGFQMRDYQHTWDGQGEFYTDCLDMIKKIDYLYGAYIYCYADAEACYICGQSNCPVETGWGLVDCNGNPKPSYYAVQAAFAD